MTTWDGGYSVIFEQHRLSLLFGGLDSNQYFLGLEIF